MFKCFRSWWIAAIMLTAPALIYGQADFPGTISATGNTEITQPATALRMQVEVVTEGKTIQESLAALKAKCETLRAQLGQLGASAQNIKFGDPRIFQDSSEQSRRMEAMMRARMSGGKAAKGKPAAPSIKVACTNTTEWDLKGTVEERLARAYELKTKVEEAMKPAAKGADAAAQEEAEEEEGSGQFDFGDNSPKPGQPAIVYVARLSPDEQTKALASALEKAKTQASQIAKAAGVQLGTIQNISQSMRPSFRDGAYHGGMNQYIYQMMGMDDRGESGSKDEIVGLDPSAVKLNVAMSVSWTIAK